MLALDRQLPRIRVGDYIVIHDAGAYVHSMYSMYNSRPAPPVIGYYNDDASFIMLKKGGTVIDSLAMWVDNL